MKKRRRSSRSDASRTAAAGKPRQRRATPPKAGLSARLRAVRKLFEPVELAKICGVTRQAVCQWTDLPAEHALAIEKASAGKLTKEFLAPSFYPRPA